MAHGDPFPQHFLWGAATAAYQVEGSPLSDGAGPSIWQGVNTGTQPRQVVFWLAPYQITAEEFQEVMNGLMSGEPSDAPAFNFSVNLVTRT